MNDWMNDDVSERVLHLKLKLFCVEIIVIYKL